MSSSKALTRRAIALRGLDASYSSHHFEDLRRHIEENTTCLEGSQYPLEVAMSAAKYLYFANDGKAFSNPRSWEVLHQPRLIEQWLRQLQEAGASPSTLHNKVRALKFGTDFMYVQCGRPAPEGLRDFLGGKLSLYARRRKQHEASRREAEPRPELPDLADFNSKVGQNQKARRRFEDIVAKARAMQDRGRHLDRAEYLFALRVTLQTCQTAGAARPSALYTLDVSRVLEAHRGQGTDPSPMVIRSTSHKTSAARGATLIVLESEEDKRTLLDFVTYVRPRCPAKPKSGHVFLNTAGRQLSSSQVGFHLRQHQMTCGWEAQPVLATKFRKAVVTGLRTRDRQQHGASLDEICVALNHSRATQDTYYDRNLRRDAAISAHRRIRELLATGDAV